MYFSLFITLAFQNICLLHSRGSQFVLLHQLCLGFCLGLVWEYIAKRVSFLGASALRGGRYLIVLMGHVSHSMHMFIECPYISCSWCCIPAIFFTVGGSTKTQADFGAYLYSVVYTRLKFSKIFWILFDRSVEWDRLSLLAYSITSQFGEIS